jgi:PKD domain/Secretion system C-terminal sorting domain
MKKALLLISGIICLLFSGSKASCVDSSHIDPSRICPLVFIPTCGCDGNGYGNPCEAYWYGGVNSWRIGICGADTLCSANFNFIVNGDSVQFINLSTSRDSIVVNAWDFGDGSYDSTFSPNHFFLFNTDTQFTICLSITSSSGCYNTFCQNIKLTSACSASFGYRDSAGYVSFYDSSRYTGRTHAWHWNFDDGTSSAARNPVHRYTYTGVHTVCLTIYDYADTDTCVSSYCAFVTSTVAPCIDHSLVDSSRYCPDVNPVCGCDSVTYRNACAARYYSGITSYHAGPCLSGIDFRNEHFNMLVFPNPSQGSFQISALSPGIGNVEISLLDMSGRVVLELYKGSWKEQWNFSNLNINSGLYFLQLRAGEQSIRRKMAFY